MASRDMERLMWAQACEMLDRADRLQRQFFQPDPAGTRGPTWRPPMDIFEDERAIHIVVALPGVDTAHLEVGFRDNAFVIAGERPLPSAAGGTAVRRMEIPQGHFERRVELPVGRFEIGRRELVDGCLHVSLNKNPGAQP